MKNRKEFFMKKILTLLTVLIVRFGCFSKAKEEASPSTLFVEDGVVKYNNNGNIEGINVTDGILTLKIHKIG